jgi:tetratricopeptide (TPR) repeat protein
MSNPGSADEMSTLAYQMNLFATLFPGRSARPFKRKRRAIPLPMWQRTSKSVSLKRLLSLMGALLVGISFAARAESPDAQFVRIYKLIQDADTLIANGQAPSAIEQYLDAQTALKNLQKVNPSWNEKVIKFRLNYVAEKLSTLNAQAPPAKSPPSPTATTPTARLPEPQQNDSRLDGLNQQVRTLEADKRLLEAKLREALSAQPAAIDPRELQKAEAKIRLVQKENDLLKVTVERARAKTDKPIDTSALEQTRNALADANFKLREQAAANARLELEKRELNERLLVLTASPRPAPIERKPSNTLESDTPPTVLNRQKDFEDTRLNLQRQTERIKQLTLERDALRKQLQTASPAKQLAALRTENESLKKQLAAAKSAGPRDNLGQQLQATRAELASQKSTNEALRLEKGVLERQLKELASKADKPAAPPGPADQRRADRTEAERIKRLERERDELQKKLNAANQELAKNRPPAKSSKKNPLTARQVEALNARLAVLQARKVPYTPEELALFKEPRRIPAPPVQVVNPPKTTTEFAVASATKDTPAPVATPGKRTEPPPEPKPAKKSIKDLPPGAASLVNEAQRAFAARHLDEAENKYLQALKLDEKSVFLLANLATIQLEQNRLSEAEANLKRALVGAPDDAFSLSLYGILKFRQEKLDEAEEALSRAAKIDPQNPETQNYLGITFSQKGLREAAEGALRKAIQLSPSYPSAHYNLAVVYATQRPPFRELARLHYQKAVSAGHPKNPDLEKLFEPDIPLGQSK